MVFAEPQNLLFFALLIPLAAAWIFYTLWYRKVRRRAGDSPLISAMTTSVDRRGQALSRVCQFVGLMLIIVALAQPQWGMSDEEVEQQAMDIVFAMDLSRSMLAEDVSPNRQMAANQELVETMKRLEGDRVGLVIFTSISFIQSPLTTDYPTIDFFLRRLHPDQIPVGGTSIGAAMRDSIEVLQGRSYGSDSTKMQQADNQVIVLLTDGEDHESSPTAAAEQARELGIRVVTVGVGSREGARIPDFDDRGRRRGYVRDRDGEPVITRLDEDTLRQMAQLTGGTYIHFDRPGRVADELTAYLDELERTTFEMLMSERYIDRFLYFLIPGFLLLFISLFLGNRKLSQKNRLRRLLPFSLLFIFMLSTGCDSAFQRLDPAADRAAEAMARNSFEEALSYLDEIAESHGDRPEYHFNRGRALLGMEEYDRARESFARALTADDPHLRADVHYHIGLAMGAEEEWREAHDSFQQGLRLFSSDNPPEDPELRRALQDNLEIALRELFPPCSTLEDEFEPNNSPGEATALEEPLLEDLTLCGGNDDYFALGATPDATLNVTVSLRQLREDPDPEQVFLPSSSGVQLTLYDATGEAILDLDQGREDDPDALDRQNRQQVVERRIEDFQIESSHLQNQAEGPLFIGLRAADGLEFAYDLEVEYIPSCSILDDQYEPNATAGEAARLNVGEHQLHLCPEDEDWFRVPVDLRHSFFVDVQPHPDMERDVPPELQLEIRRAGNQQVISTGQWDGNYLTAGVQDVDFAGDLLVRVLGVDDDQQGPYSLEIHHIEPCSQARAGAPELDPEQMEHRYLRRCDETDADTYRITPGQEGTVEWALQTLPEQAWTEPFGDFPEMELHLISIEDRQVVATAVAPQPASPQPNADDRPLTLDKFLAVEEPDVPDHPILQVEGDEGFYHLRRMDDQDQDDQDDEQDDDQDQDDQDQDDDGDDDQDQDDQDQDDQDDDGEDGEDEDSQDEDESEDGQDDETQDDEDEDGQEEDESAPEDADEEEEELSAEHRDILRSLEDSDQNFQMQQRLKDTPRRQLERDW